MMKTKKLFLGASPSMNRRRFLSTGISAGAVLISTRAGGTRSAPAAEIDPQEATVPQLQNMMQEGGWTSRKLVEYYLERINRIDRQGPRINSVIEINPDAIAVAAALDEERRSKGPRGPLHGVPILIKDNIDTADRMKTTAGSLALAESTAIQDSYVARRLREAGAVLLGKTNLSEWANFRSTHSTSGWSARGGQTRNPYALDRNPCGSSSGSGVAVSANLCAVAVGTETDGSIVCPSSTNGIVGIKPTLGLISRAGIVPIAHSQDTAGPMARTVGDAAIMLGILSAPDPNDKATGVRPAALPRDYTQFLDPHGLKGSRIGVAREFFGFSDKVDKVMEDALREMRSAGAVVVDLPPVLKPGRYEETELEVMLFEFKADLTAYLARVGPGVRVRTLKDLIDFNERNREQEMPYFGQELFIRAEAKGPLTSAAYRKALTRNQRLSRAEGIDAAISRYRLDAMVAPTGGPACVTDLVNGDHFSGGCSTPAAVAGYPHITVPAGFVFGLPVGISFFGGAYSEPALIRVSHAFAQATRQRKPPRFLQSAELA
jgi:amidase